jgi:hypothetical protein
VAIKKILYQKTINFILMKKYYLTLALQCIVCFSFAQRIAITTGMETLNGEFRKSYNLFVPHATVKALSHAWIDYLKDNRAKVKTSGDEINTMSVVIPMISKDTLQVFAKASAVAEGASLSAAFLLPDGAVSQELSADASQAIMKILHDLALPVAKDGLKDKIALSQKAVDSKERESDALIKRNEKLKADNERMQNQMHDNEREMQDNEKKISAVKSEIGAGKESLDAVKAKEKDLD